ncbi:LytR cell envelope-related transcriptional attenuator [Pedococcus dokdonensis]|uniref:LytR cell envelope-related transcriptional attenuator n=1 Tax=Pedococcus dokdonensis TaxID=443156 RepID=A0A1H0UGG2_9MICO|nr:LytR C-terminal domain-containing protein [Pedococcus dokdonensis]SDP65382.1 LytR cell envelope-related transcriptional attenuator [Pedococcus dokdonensis]
MKAEDLTPTQLWRKHRLRQVMLFVTIPGVLLGTASMTAAYSAGWMTPAPPKPACTPVVVPAPARGSFTVNVMNATGRNGVAGQVAAGLGKRKFEIRGISNAPESWYVTQPAVVHHGPAGLDQALLTASQIPGAKLFADSRKGTSVDVVVGLAYTGMVALPPRLKPIPSEVHVNVYNTTYRTGLAQSVADEVTSRGFKVEDVANDPLRTMTAGTAVIRYGEQGDLAAALLAGHVPGAQLVKDTRPDASVDLVIGNAFSALTPTAEVPPLPARPKQPTPTVARPCT